MRWLLLLAGTVLACAAGLGTVAEPAATASRGAEQAVWPVQGPVVRGFSPPSTLYGPGHRGIDVAAAPGSPVRAALSGTVAFAGQVAGAGWVTIDHGGGLSTTYGHLGAIVVSVGQRVTAGEVIGRLAERAHLDFGARRRGDYIDPLTLFRPPRARLIPHDPLPPR